MCAILTIGPDLKNLLPARDLRCSGQGKPDGKVLSNLVGSPGMAGAAYFSAKAA